MHLEIPIKTTTSKVNHECEEADLVSGPYGAACCGIYVDMHGGLPGVPAERTRVHLESHPCIYYDCDWLPCDPHRGLLGHLPQHEEQDVPKRTTTKHPSLHH